MSLHKQLVAAFGRAETPDPADRGNEVHQDDGYFWRRIGCAMVINASGELVDIDGPPWRFGGKRRRNSLLVPQKQFVSDGGCSGFLWGQSLHALGVGRDGPDGLRTSSESFNRFRMFHKAVLNGAKSPSLRAFLLFLQRWDPHTDLGAAAEAAGTSVVFRFRYDDCFLHEGHAARMIWARLLNPAPRAPPDSLRIRQS